jgi:hypothetical protein
MKKVLLAVSLVTLGFAGMAQAQATRTWVSGVGDDVNPCSRTAPCKTFAGAISKTASPGIINCLDPGGFGAVTITKSITIDCTSTLGSVLSSSVQGIVVNAQTTDKIVLRGLDINGAGTTLGTNGVNIIQAKSVQMFNVRISTYSGNGIQATNTSNAVSVYVDSCQILNVGGTGILMSPTATGSTKLAVNNSSITNSATGIDAVLNTDAYVKNSVIAENSGTGFLVESNTDTAGLDGVMITNNNIGVQAGSSSAAAINMSRCFVLRNAAQGVFVGFAGSQIVGWQTNTITNNGGNNNVTSSNPST